MRRLTLILFVTGFLTIAVNAFDHSHQQLTSVMSQVNKKGLIDYQGLKNDPSRLNSYLESLSNLKETDFRSWTEQDQIAFWTNAYNAYTLKAIIENYPIKSSFLKSKLYPKNSIRQISGVWDKLKWDVMGIEMTLNEIEHETLRKNYNEPRIHMALVCAAMSCPSLREEAYTGKKLDNQFKDQTNQFLLNPQAFRIDKTKKVIYLSAIFDWFGEDFIKTYGGVRQFISQHLSGEDKSILLSNDYSIKYLKYDWSLNEQ